MADIPEAAVQAALARRAGLLSDQPDPMVLSEETLTRLMLEAAGPILAETVAREILTYAERQFPKNDPAKVPGRPDLWRIWHRHFSIAARIAVGAFFADEDMKMIAAERIGVWRARSTQEEETSDGH